MNRDEIKGLLPHREPMLLIDEVHLEGDTAVGSYTVRGDEFFLQGHFPGAPIVPGVILCEMMGQASCLLIGGQDVPGDPADGKLPYFTGMEKVRFRRPVRPGDTLTVRSQLLRTKPPFYFVAATGSVGDTHCVSAELSFALVDRT